MERALAVSKSKILSSLQCSKRLWLETNRPELRARMPAEKRLQVGHEVGEIARRLFDPTASGNLIDVGSGYDEAFVKTAELLGSSKPIFEAAFRNAEAFCFSDILVPVTKAARTSWRMIEVKSAASVKDRHIQDIAIQVKLARDCGVQLHAAEVAHIDASWTYPGGEDYRGLLATCDLTDQVLSCAEQVGEWITSASAVLRRPDEPDVKMGDHCTSPLECPYTEYCRSQTTQPEHPVDWIPRLSKKAKAYIRENEVTEMRDLPNDLLNKLQRRVKKHTLSGKPFFDRIKTANVLAAYSAPAYFLDFETVALAVPIWPGTRPYQQIPFQFSVHRLSRAASIEHRAFLDLSGKDPSPELAKQLVEACGRIGPIYAYNAGFERSCIEYLAVRVPKLRRSLRSLNKRIVDLLDIARNHYYHPRQEGSWSIKRVLPTLAPELDYEALEGVHDGGGAVEAYLEAIHLQTQQSRREEIRIQLESYCQLDTFGMVKIFDKFRGA